jgi:hypothetical protein
MPKIVQESQVAGTREDGSNILLPEVEVVVKNAKTDVEYDDDDAADADVNDPNTETTAADINRSVAIRVLKGVGATGDAGV